MCEKEFTRCVKQVKDEQARKDRASCDTVDKIISIICAKQTRMKSDKEWNIMSPEDTMMMTLVWIIDAKQKNGKTKNNKTKQEKGKEKEKPKDPKKQLTGEECKKLKESRIVDWMKKAPKPGKPKAKEVDGCTYHFCSKCCDGKGMWVLCKESNRKDNFKQSPKSDKSENGKKKSERRKALEMVQQFKSTFSC